MKQKIKNLFKYILPKKLWNFIRHYKDLLRDWASNRGAKVCRIDYCGFRLCYSPGTILIKKIRDGKIFEEKMCKAIADELKKSPKPVMLDIGSNIGLISLYSMANVPDLKIYAFEPGPHQNEFFGKTISENKLDQKIVLSSEALGNKEGSMTFISHFSPDCSGDGFIDTGRAGEPIPVEVPVTTLDKWWSENSEQKIDVMKIDIEGAELWALEGAVNLLRQVKPVIFMEIEPKNLKVYPYDRDSIFKWLDEHGYSLYTLDNELCTAENWGSFAGKYDTYIARPAAKK